MTAAMLPSLLASFPKLSIELQDPKWQQPGETDGLQPRRSWITTAAELDYNLGMTDNLSHELVFCQGASMGFRDGVQWSVMACPFAETVRATGGSKTTSLWVVA